MLSTLFYFRFLPGSDIEITKDDNVVINRDVPCKIVQDGVKLVLVCRVSLLVGVYMLNSITHFFSCNWRCIKKMLSDYLFKLWREGALHHIPIQCRHYHASPARTESQGNDLNCLSGHTFILYVDRKLLNVRTSPTHLSLSLCLVASFAMNIPCRDDHSVKSQSCSF